MFGMGGDPRLGLLMDAERERVRKEYIEPVIEQRQNLRDKIRLVKQNNHRTASEIRSSLRKMLGKEI